MKLTIVGGGMKNWLQLHLWRNQQNVSCVINTLTNPANEELAWLYTRRNGYEEEVAQFDSLIESLSVQYESTYKKKAVFDPSNNAKKIVNNGSLQTLCILSQYGLLLTC
jgi:hypothetical protein